MKRTTAPDTLIHSVFTANRGHGSWPSACIRSMEGAESVELNGMRSVQPPAGWGAHRGIVTILRCRARPAAEPRSGRVRNDLPVLRSPRR